MKCVLDDLCGEQLMAYYSSHVIGPTCHYDVIDFVFVAKLRNKKRHIDKSVLSRDQ